MWQRSGAIAMFLSLAIARAFGQEAYLSAGFGGSADYAGFWQSALVTPFGELDDTGPLVRGIVSELRFAYDTTLPDDPEARVEAQGMAGLLEGGWQWSHEESRLSLSAGVAARDYTLKPDDPGSDLEGLAWSASLSAQARTPLPWVSGWDVAADISWQPQLGQFWGQARPGFDLGDNLRIGPEAAVSLGPDYLFLRAGAFVSGYRLTLASTEFYLGGMGGISSEVGAFTPSPYGGVWAGVKF
jgi:hypothetical protein